MVAAAPLGNVMEQAAQVSDFGFLEVLHDAAAMRVLMIEAGESEAAQVADDKQRVLIDRVGMEQVVLHAPHDAAKRRDVEAENAIQVHAPQLVRDTFRRSENRQEQAVVPRVLPKFLVDQVQVAFDQADREGADAANLGILLQ